MDYEYPGDEVFDRIEELCDKGDAYMDNQKYRPAIKRFWKAFDLLPEPKTQYPSGTWLLVSISDANFQVGNYAGGAENLTRAKAFPEGEGNPFLHFRLAQCQLELEDEEAALLEFKKAVAIDGLSIFEDENPKYLAFFQGKNK